MDTRYLRGFQQPLLVYLSIVDSNIAGYALREYHTVLHHHSALPTPPLLIQRADVSATDADLSFQHGIIAQHQLYKRSLSAARGSHDGCHLTFGDMYGDVIQGLGQSMWVIFEHDTVYVYSLAAVVQGGMQPPSFRSRPPHGVFH